MKILLSNLAPAVTTEVNTEAVEEAGITAQVTHLVVTAKKVVAMSQELMTLANPQETNITVAVAV